MNKDFSNYYFTDKIKESQTKNVFVHFYKIFPNWEIIKKWWNSLSFLQKNIFVIVIVLIIALIFFLWINEFRNRNFKIIETETWLPSPYPDTIPYPTPCKNRVEDKEYPNLINFERRNFNNLNNIRL
jgi:hypothetical protein